MKVYLVETGAYNLVYFTDGEIVAYMEPYQNMGITHWNQNGEEGDEWKARAIKEIVAQIEEDDITINDVLSILPDNVFKFSEIIEDEPEFEMTLCYEKSVDISIEEYASRHDLTESILISRAECGAFKTAKKHGNKYWWLSEDEPLAQFTTSKNTYAIGTIHGHAYKITRLSK